MGAVTKRKWFLHFLRCSVAQRKGRVAVASFSVTIAAAIIVCAIGISLGIRQKLGGELKAYGANVMITPDEGYIDEAALGSLKDLPGIRALSVQVYAHVSLNGTGVELIGLEMQGMKEQGWKVSGGWPGEGEVLLGQDLKGALGLESGGQVTLATEGGRVALKRVSGFVQRGGPEDRAVLMEKADSQAFLGLDGKLSAMLLSVDTGALDETVSMIGGRVKGVRIKTLRQVAYAEEAFLGKMELLMLLVTAVVLVATAISVSSTMSATVLERMKEIGLMKALGGTRKDIGGFFISEGVAIGMIGGVVGYVLGFACAQAVSRGAFGSFISVPLYLLPGAAAFGAALGVASSLGPVLDALRRKPSTVLREE